MEQLSIGKMAKLNGTTPRALRFYAEKGLLEPRHVDPDSGFRYYDIRQCFDLDRIQELQSLGCSLEEIATVMQASGDDAYKAVLTQKLAAYDEQIRTLQERSAMARGLLKKANASAKVRILESPLIETLPARPITRVDVSTLGPSSTSDGYESVRNHWEYVLRAVKAELAHSGHPAAALLNVGCGISRRNLIARNYVFDTFFLFEDDVRLEGLGTVREIMPAGTYAVLYSAGSLDETGAYKTPRNIDTLLSCIDEQGYEVAGDYFDEILGETPDVDGSRVMFFKMYVPITPRAATKKAAGPTPSRP